MVKDNLRTSRKRWRHTVIRSYCTFQYRSIQSILEANREEITSVVTLRKDLKEMVRAGTMSEIRNINPKRLQYKTIINREELKV